MPLYKSEDSAGYVQGDDTQPFDERKPRVPYIKGWRFIVQEHTPPPPVMLKPFVLSFEDEEEAVKMRQLHPSKRCLENPPLFGSYGSSYLELQIHHTLRIEGLSKGQLVVAKLYDPMYIDDDEFYINPFLVSDKEYTNEAAAYKALSDFQGSTIPQYYGSYSLNIPLEEIEDKRSVRLILIKYIPGISTQKAIPDQLSQNFRQSIIKSLIEFDTLVYAKNILLRDLHPRNIMMTESGHAVFIDFADADIGWGITRAHNRFSLPESKSNNIASPLLRWHTSNDRHSVFSDWVDWYWQPWLQAEFQHSAGVITPEMIAYFAPRLLYVKMGGDIAESLRMIVGG